MSQKITLITDSKLEALVGPEPVLTWQYVDRLRIKDILQPEKRLMLAVLDDVVTSILNYARGRNAGEKRLFRQAETWIMATDEDWPFSFVSICEALGLNPGSLRAALIRKSITLRNVEGRELLDPSMRRPTSSHAMSLGTRALTRNRNTRRRAVMNKQFAQESCCGWGRWKSAHRKNFRRCLTETESLFVIPTDAIKTIVCASCADEARRLGLSFEIWTGRAPPPD